MVLFAVEDIGTDGVKLLQMKAVTDDRCTVREFYRESAFIAAGLGSLGPWVQVNVTGTVHGAVRDCTGRP